MGILIVVVTLITGVFSGKKALVTSLIILLSIVQLYFSDFEDVYLDNDEQRVMNERLISYPLLYIPVFTKAIWIEPEWIESNPYVIFLSKIENNIFTLLDLNYYFFGGYPRGVPSDYEKIPFILLPFFIIGILDLIKRKMFFYSSILFFVPFFAETITRINDLLGSFALFPFFITSIYFGILATAKKFKAKAFYLLLLISILITLFLQISFVYA